VNCDPTKLKAVKALDHAGIFFGLARVPGTGRLFAGCSDAKVYAVDVAAEKPEWKELGAGQAGAASGIRHEGYVTGVALAGPFVVTGAYDGNLIWWNSETLVPIRKIAAHSKWVRGVTASRDGRFIASVADDMLCKIWNTQTGDVVHVLAGHQTHTPQHYPSMLYAAGFSSDGRFLATADKVGHVVVWDATSGKQLAAVETPLMYTWDPRQRRHSIGGVRSVAFSYDGKLLATGGTGQINNVDHLEALARLEVFDWQANKRVFEHAGDKHKGLVERIEFSPDGEWLVCAGGDHEGFIKFLSLDGKVLHQDKAPMHVHDFELNDSCDGLYASGHGKLVEFEFKIAAPPIPDAPALPTEG
jgi:WD40 repeat protein